MLLRRRKTRKCFEVMGAAILMTGTHRALSLRCSADRQGIGFFLICKHTYTHTGHAQTPFLGRGAMTQFSTKVYHAFVAC